jgi:hypothetical protein
VCKKAATRSAVSKCNEQLAAWDRAQFELAEAPAQSELAKAASTPRYPKSLYSHYINLAQLSTGTRTILSAGDIACEAPRHGVSIKGVSVHAARAVKDAALTVEGRSFAHESAVTHDQGREAVYGESRTLHDSCAVMLRILPCAVP